MALKIKYRGTEDKDITLGFRVTEKMRYGLEKLAKKHQTTLSAICTHGLDKLLNDKEEGLWTTTETGRSVFILDKVWHPEPSERLVRLAHLAEHLLTDHEMCMWTLIRDNRKYWNDREPRLEVIRKNWDSLEKEAHRRLKN